MKRGREEAGGKDPPAGEEDPPKRNNRRCADWDGASTYECRWRVYPMDAGFPADAAEARGLSPPQQESREYCARHTREVVACPVDPSHTVRLDKVHRHVHVCPALVQCRAARAFAGHVPGVNFPPHVETDEGVRRGEEGPSPIDIRTPGTDHKAVAVGGRKLAIKNRQKIGMQAAGGISNRAKKLSALQTLLQGLDPAPMQRVVRLVERAHEALLEACGSSCDFFSVQQLAPEALVQARKRLEAVVHQDMPSKGFQGERAGHGGGKTQRGRHAVQQVSILAHMIDEGMMPAPGGEEGGARRGCNFVELGCGMGYLSAMASYTWGKNVHVVLVDRESSKKKADKLCRDMAGGVTRVKTDIGHLWLPGVLSDGNTEGGNTGKLEQVAGSADTTRTIGTNSVKVEETNPENPSFVAASKHLCGAATDFALRCCVNARAAANLNGIAIATCCRHQCDFGAYANRAVMERLGFTPNDFQVMAHMCAWPGSIKGGRPAGETRDAEAEGPPAVGELMSQAEKVRVGLLATQVIDLGRVMWLQEQGLRAKVVKFVGDDDTTENHLLLALPAG